MTASRGPRRKVRAPFGCVEGMDRKVRQAFKHGRSMRRITIEHGRATHKWRYRIERMFGGFRIGGAIATGAINSPLVT